MDELAEAFLKGVRDHAEADETVHMKVEEQALERKADRVDTDQLHSAGRRIGYMRQRPGKEPDHKGIAGEFTTSAPLTAIKNDSAFYCQAEKGELR